MSEAEGAKIRVFYDGMCPFCRRTMEGYRRRTGTVDFVYVDIASPDFDAGGEGLDPAAVRRALHVALPDGRVVAGGDAVLALWERMGGYGAVARILRWPGLHAFFLLCYRWFAGRRHWLGRG